jgi:membrane-anchored protein YejM (alkaline phosphatase superfamily)
VFGYDAFATVVGEELGTEPLERRISRGSATREWVRANFAGRTLDDLVYVDSNAHYQHLSDEIDAAVFKYRLVENDLFGGVTAHPDAVTDAALDAAETYPHKRLLVHYMQPHHPFIGPSAVDLEHEDSFLKTVRENGLDRETVVAYYRENLDIALESVRRLVDGVEGRIVVTSDHGEMLGNRERPIPVVRYYHPEKLYVPELVEVPWLVHETGERPRIRGGDLQRDESALDEEAIDEKLRDLGYRV